MEADFDGAEVRSASLIAFVTAVIGLPAIAHDLSAITTDDFQIDTSRLLGENMEQVTKIETGHNWGTCLICDAPNIAVLHLYPPQHDTLMPLPEFRAAMNDLAAACDRAPYTCQADYIDLGHSEGLMISRNQNGTYSIDYTIRHKDMLFVVGAVALDQNAVQNNAAYLYDVLLQTLKETHR